MPTSSPDGGKANQRRRVAPVCHRRRAAPVCAVRTSKAPVSPRETGALTEPSRQQSSVGADVHPAEPGDPPPAAGANHHEAEAAAPVAMVPMMAVMAAAFPSAAGGSLGRDERGCADGGDGGDGKNRLADHGSLLVLLGCVRTSCLSVGRTNRRVQGRPNQLEFLFFLGSDFPAPLRSGSRVRTLPCLGAIAISRRDRTSS